MTTVLNAVTYLDMALRGRASSSTPEQTVERLSQVLHLPVPGDGEAREDRVAGSGPLTGIAAGVGSGALLGDRSRAGPARPLLTARLRDRHADLWTTTGLWTVAGPVGGPP